MIMKTILKIPNSVIGKEFITNYSMPDRIFRFETFVIISYGQDIEYVRSLILEALAHEDWTMQDKPIQALLFDFTEFGVKFKVRCWIEKTLWKPGFRRTGSTRRSTKL